MAQEVVIPNEEVLSKQILILDMICFFFWGGGGGGDDSPPVYILKSCTILYCSICLYFIIYTWIFLQLVVKQKYALLNTKCGLL